MKPATAITSMTQMQSARQGRLDVATADNAAMSELFTNHSPGPRLFCLTASLFQVLTISGSWDRLSSSWRLLFLRLRFAM